MTNDSSNSNQANRSRRKFLKTAGVTTLGVPLAVGSVQGTEYVSALAQSEPSVQPQSSDNMYMGRDRDTDSDTSAEGSLQMELHRWGGTLAGQVILIPIDQQSSAETHLNDNSPIDHIDHSIVDVTWDTDDNGNILDNSPNSYNTGGYEGQFEQPDDYSFAEAVLETAHDEFLDWIGSTLAGPIYSGSKFAGEVYEKTTSNSGGTGVVTREWNWTYEKYASNWSQYYAEVEQDEVFEVEFSHLMYLMGMKNLWCNASMNLLGVSFSSHEVDDMTASEAKEHDVDVYHLDAVKKDPAKFGVTEEIVKDYPGEYLYQVPVKTEFTGSRESPSEEFIERHRDSIEEKAPELLE